ncbi:MAG: hypothetical protein R3234_03870 [Thermoanaerobaculia bacterium]|nr:hypothetical protein [Thermoanaerobaculia bacterium]
MDLGQKLIRVWKDPGCRLSILTITLVVGILVTAANRALGRRLGPTGWLLFHASLPTVVFGLGAISNGVRRPDRALVARGLTTVVVVAAAFTLVNRVGHLPFPARLGLNLLVPAVVSSLGATGGIEDRS